MPRYRDSIESLLPGEQAVARLTNAGNGPNAATASMAVAVWFNPGSGFLACLLDEKWERVDGSTTFDYHPTIEAAVLQLQRDAIARAAGGSWE